MTLMPPTIAVSMRPARRASAAWWSATSDDEHAVSKRDARTVEVVDIGDPVGENGERVAGGEMRIRDRLVAVDRVRVIGLRGADEDADFGAGDRGWADAGIFERFPGQLQQDPLLRIHLRRLARRDAEDARIKTPDVVEDAGRPGIAFAAFVASWMPVARQRETVVRHSRNGATAFEQQRPQIGDAIRPRQPARPTDDGDFVMQIMNWSQIVPRFRAPRRQSPQGRILPVHRRRERSLRPK